MRAIGELRPATRGELIEAICEAADRRRPLSITGGGTHTPAVPALDADHDRLITTGLAQVVDHTPADLTVTVEGGVRAETLDELLRGHGQCWPQADIRPGSTVGGILAAGASGHRRLREGPVRDSLLEVVVVTGDGRVVTGGGRTVKNVSGFDLPRLMVGAHGTLGVIAQATLKLWPTPRHAAWFARAGNPVALLDEAARLVAAPVRPAAVLMSPHGLHVELVGPADDVRAPEGFARADPPLPDLGADAAMRVGVPPTRLSALVELLAAEGVDFLAQMGVGACEAAVGNRARALELREWAEAAGGHAVVAHDRAGLGIDSWGADPVGARQMERLRTGFDPPGILNPGRMAGDARAAARGSRP